MKNIKSNELRAIRQELRQSIERLYIAETSNKFENKTAYNRSRRTVLNLIAHIKDITTCLEYR